MIRWEILMAFRRVLVLFVVFSLEVGDSPVEQIITALKHQLKKENTVVYRNRGVKE